MTSEATDWVSQSCTLPTAEQPLRIAEFDDLFATGLLGLERLTPGATYMFVSNHQSHYDTPVVFSSLPYQLRIIAKESLGKFPVLGWHLKRSGHLFVDRQQPDRVGIVRRWKELVSEGTSLIIFAEGTRSSDGRVARFKAGSFLLALEAGLTIVPLSISGSINVMRKGGLTTRPGRVRLTVHPPIAPTKIASPSVTDARDLARRIEEIVRTGVLSAERGFEGSEHPAH